MELGRAGTALAFDSIVIDDTMGGARENGDDTVGQGASRQEAERIAMGNCTLGGNKACRVEVIPSGPGF